MIGIIDTDDLKQIVKEVIQDQLKDVRPPAKLTLKQLADEWQVARQSIMAWTRRDQFKLPVHYVGSDPRFHRDEVEAWSKAEAERKLADMALSS